MPNTGEAILKDLIARTEKAVESIAGLSAHTGITFKVTDIVDAVERDLPANYPAPTGNPTRQGLIAIIAQDILSGEIYEDGDEPVNP
jgi:hypothetical protein